MPQAVLDAIRVITDPQPGDSPLLRRLAWRVLTGPQGRDWLRGRA